jgi:uncharacterized membrane protein YvbJ
MCCSNCGKNIPDASKFCSFCGEKCVDIESKVQNADRADSVTTEDEINAASNAAPIASSNSNSDNLHEKLSTNKKKDGVLARLFVSYVLSGFIFTASKNLSKSLADEFVIAVITILAGIAFYRARRDFVFGIKNKFLANTVLFIIYSFYSAFFIGVLTKLI